MTKTILIVEDEPDILQVEKMALESAGYACVSASTLEEARDQVASRLPDLVILDIVLPGQPGYVFSRELRENERTRQIPILCVTGRTEPLVRRIAMASGADDFLTKPFEIQDILDRVSTRLEDARTSGKPLIVLADDDFEILSTLRLALEDAGFSVETAGNGVEACAVIARYRPHLIILDIVMPGKSGFEVCRQIHNDPDLSGIPVILFTGTPQPGFSEWASAVGAVDYLTKDQGIECLLERVQECLGKVA